MTKIPQTFHEFNLQVHSLFTSLQDNLEGGDDQTASFIARRLRGYVEDVARERPSYLNGLSPIQYLKKLSNECK